MRSRQYNQNKAVSRADKAIDEDTEDDEDLMCFDGKTGGWVHFGNGISRVLG